MYVLQASSRNVSKSMFQEVNKLDRCQENPPPFRLLTMLWSETSQKHNLLKLRHRLEQMLTEMCCIKGRRMGIKQWYFFVWMAPVIAITFGFSVEFPSHSNLLCILLIMVFVKCAS